MKIAICGTGYVGLTTGASLANLGHEVLCVDIDTAKLAQLEQGIVPFYEPGLKELVLKNKEKKRLSFTADMKTAVDYADVIFNCVGTPERDDGSADLSFVYTVVDAVAALSKQDKVYVTKSTVPPGTARKLHQRLREIIREKNNAITIHVVSNPEFLKQGNAVYDFTHPDKIIVGAESEHAFAMMRKVYHGLVKTYIPLLEMDWETAEITKYANNAFLATKISFINEIANICSLYGADIRLVAKAIGMDYRIGSKFLNAGIGYGGSCFPKDVRALSSAAQQKGYEARLLKEVHELNERQKTIIVPQILNTLSSHSSPTVTIWGLSFKPKTSDIRSAVSLPLIESLLTAGVTIKAYDPVAMEEAKKIFGKKITYSPSIEESVAGSNCIIVVTEWDEFRNVDFSTIGKLMHSKIIFDGRNIYEPADLEEEGFLYFGIGRGNRP